jgi:poly-beta-1,6-N-acetyl-D-glucosamine biosynthesis protein PgaD
MDQSRPRAETIVSQTLIIESPQWQDVRQRMVYGSLTVAFWLLWSYLWLPVVGILGWIVGIGAAHYHMIILEGYRGLSALLPLYLLIIALLGGSLISWAQYNLIRYRGTQRRTRSKDVHLEMLAAHFAVDATALSQWLELRRLVLHHDQHGRLIEVEVRPDDA